MDIPLYNDLSEQVALVTGATRGIGEQIAASLADAGATVYAGARNPADVTATTQRPIELDVTDESDITAAVDHIAEAADRLDILVNNAGIMDSREPLAEMPTDVIEDTLTTNLHGPILLTKCALPLLLDQSGGRVVNVSSGLGQITDSQSGDMPAYRISKTGLNGLTKYLHGEYHDDGLLANSVCPGYVQTALLNPPTAG